MPHALVIGGNRGIGLELVRQLLARSAPAWRVSVICRSGTPELAALPAETHADIDVTTDAGLTAAKAALAGQSVDLLVVVAGLLERNTLGDLDVSSVRAQFEINALAPLRLVDAFASQLPKGAKVALLTSRMGSIADNDSGSHYGYRMSKAALNAYCIKNGVVYLTIVNRGCLGLSSLPSGLAVVRTEGIGVFSVFALSVAEGSYGVTSNPMPAPVSRA